MPVGLWELKQGKRCRITDEPHLFYKAYGTSFTQTT